jgi:hypothetical protein
MIIVQVQIGYFQLTLMINCDTDLIKKPTAHGHEITPAKLAYELRDVLWYIAEAASAGGLSLGRYRQ